MVVVYWRWLCYIRSSPTPVDLGSNSNHVCRAPVPLHQRS